MKYKILPWSIETLISEYNKNNLDLNPPYQRNNIWSEKAQKTLISSIKEGLPIPAFFLHEKGNGKYDIADGQQRTRAILAYVKGEITDLFGNTYSQDINNYQLATIIIDKSLNQEAIRQFYVTVNNTGLRLNTPELTKAKYFSTSILQLVEGLSEDPKFESLGIFNKKQSDRMIDREFVEELVAQLKYGIGDKKNDIKKLYSGTFDDSELELLSKKFLYVLDLLSKQKVFDLSKTRYSQRNDFYTLFGFIDKYEKIDEATYEVFLSILNAVQSDISPSNDRSIDLQTYAYNCVLQSNSKTAREDRLKLFENLLLNKDGKPNKLQARILKYYKLSENDTIITSDGYKVIDPAKIQTQFKK